MTQYACDEPAFLWQWNGRSWLSGSAQPRARLVYDSTRHRTLALSDRTYVWDGATWTAIAGPSPMGPAAFDSIRGEVVVYSVAGAEPQTWVFDGASWTLAQPMHQPPARNYASLAWAPGIDRLVLWGGSLDGQPSQARTTETWLWDGSDWTKNTDAVAPPGSEAQVMNSGPGGALLYTVNPAGTAESWSFGQKGWTRSSATAPPARFGAALAYDPSNNVSYLFGGDRGDCCGSKSNELWSFDGATWRRVGP